MKLLTNLIGKFKNVKGETKKRIISTLLACGIALSGVGMSACENPLNPNDPGTEITNPGQNGGTQNPDYSKYSQILQNVLTDQYYKNLIITDKFGSKDYGNKNSYAHQKFKAIPYGFLEDEGYDAEKIKDRGNNIHVDSNMYTIGNDLFIELTVETKASTNYYTQYIVKYNLTNQELKELNALFVNVRSDRHKDCKVTNYQAPFFVQELSYHKNAELISKMNITHSALLAVTDYFNRYDYNSSTNHVTYINRVAIDDYSNVTDHTFQTHKYVSDNDKTQKVKSKGILSTLTLQTGGTCCSNINSLTVFTEKDPTFHLFNENKQKYEKSSVDITLYSCENANFEELNTKTFNNDLNL